MKSSIFWDITTCSLLNVNQCFAGTYPPHLQGRRISQEGNRYQALNITVCQWWSLTHSPVCLHTGISPTAPAIFSRNLNYELIHSKWKWKRKTEKQSAIAVMFDSQAPTAILQVSLHLNDICRRKWHWEQPNTWWDWQWHVVMSTCQVIVLVVNMLISYCKHETM
jgi:hypothetical protein